jgi:YD repeat-containing protein
VTDALGQVKTYSCAKDDRPTAIAHSNAVHTTPNVSFAYDPYFPRLVSMTDGTGTKQYSYVPVGSLGALQLQQESGPLANSAIASAYDELGRLASRTVAGSGAETFQYDAIGRLVTHGSDLGSFTLGYLGCRAIRWARSAMWPPTSTPTSGGIQLARRIPIGRMPWMHRPMRGWPSLPDLPSIPLPDGAMMACAFYQMCGPPPPPAPSTSGTCPKLPGPLPPCPPGMSCMTSDSGGGDEQSGARPSSRQIEKIEKQLEEHGRGSVEKSLRSLQRRLAEHQSALESYRAQGGPTSSVETEIRAFESEIQAIKEVLGRTP